MQRDAEERPAEGLPETTSGRGPGRACPCGWPQGTSYDFAGRPLPGASALRTRGPAAPARAGTLPLGSAPQDAPGPGARAAPVRPEGIDAGAGPDSAGARPRGAALGRDLSAGRNPAGLRRFEAQEGLDGRGMPFGALPSVEEAPEFVLPHFAQRFLRFFEHLPADAAQRTEAAQILGHMSLPWTQHVYEHMLVVPSDWRLEVMRAWAQAVALVPAALADLALAHIEGAEPDAGLEALRAFSDVASVLAPEAYQELRELLEGQSKDRWVDILRTLADRHPRWSAPAGTAAYTVVGRSPSAAMRQFVAPPPAAQSACMAEAFDPAWGAPPDSCAGVPLRFDPRLGVYEFDEALVSQIASSAGRAGLPFREADADALRRAYADGDSVLQPYKAAGSTQWAFRWTSRSTQAGCAPP